VTDGTTCRQRLTDSSVMTYSSLAITIRGRDNDGSGLSCLLVDVRFDPILLKKSDNRMKWSDGRGFGAGRISRPTCL
jgi:hypothetical protein